MIVRVKDGWIGWDAGAGAAPVRCAVGRTGLIAEADKREGDGATPIGRYAVRRVLYRPDRGAAPETALPVSPIGEDDGWCDDPADPAYNRPVRLPFAASHEKMWREDGLYDLVLIIGHNDDPPIPPLGSAIFVHCAATDGSDFKPTEGCVALARDDLRALLAVLKPGDEIEIAE